MKLYTPEENLAIMAEEIETLEKSDLNIESNRQRLEDVKSNYEKLKHNIETGQIIYLSKLTGKRYREELSRFMDCLDLD